MEKEDQSVIETLITCSNKLNVNHDSWQASSHPHSQGSDRGREIPSPEFEEVIHTKTLSILFPSIWVIDNLWEFEPCSDSWRLLFFWLLFSKSFTSWRSWRLLRRYTFVLTLQEWKRIIYFWSSSSFWMHFRRSSMQTNNKESGKVQNYPTKFCLSSLDLSLLCFSRDHDILSLVQNSWDSSLSLFAFGRRKKSPRCERTEEISSILSFCPIWWHWTERESTTEEESAWFLDPLLSTSDSTHEVLFQDYYRRIFVWVFWLGKKIYSKSDRVCMSGSFVLSLFRETEDLVVHPLPILIESCLSFNLQRFFSLSLYFKYFESTWNHRELLLNHLQRLSDWWGRHEKKVCV